MKAIVGVLIILLPFCASANGETKLHRDPLYNKSPRSNSKTSKVSWFGSLYCVFSDHKVTKKCDLEFLREDGKVFNVIENKDLVRKHCEEHKDLKVHIEGQIQQSFLLNGGVLYIENFEVLKSLSDKKKHKKINVTRLHK